MPHVEDVLEKWNFGPGAPPLPGRVARSLSELIAPSQRASDERDWAAVATVLEDLRSLHRALELWTSVELDAAALHAEASRE